jgi:ketosteroid isomerase-like protein
MLGYEAPAEEVEAIRTWFATWHTHVAAVNFTAARGLFDDAVIGFGTFMDTVTGLDNLEQRQWRSIWPTIEGFHFNLDTLRVGVSKDRCLAFGVVTWDSTGFHEGGKPYPRPGRATVLFDPSPAARGKACTPISRSTPERRNPHTATGRKRTRPAH